jgi:hypothetical protein
MARIRLVSAEISDLLSLILNKKLKLPKFDNRGLDLGRVRKTLKWQEVEISAVISCKLWSQKLCIGLKQILLCLVSSLSKNRGYNKANKSKKYRNLYMFWKA